MRSLHTAAGALAPSSSDSDSGSSSAAEDQLEPLSAGEDDTDEESEQWKQFRDVGDGGDDDDADHIDAKIPEERFILPNDVRKKGASMLNAAEAQEQASAGAARLAADEALPEKCVGCALCSTCQPEVTWPHWLAVGCDSYQHTPCMTPCSTSTNPSLHHCLPCTQARPIRALAVPPQSTQPPVFRMFLPLCGSGHRMPPASVHPPAACSSCAVALFAVAHATTSNRPCVVPFVAGTQQEYAPLPARCA